MWQHPHSKCRHMIDHILVRRMHRGDIGDARTLRSADCWSDHCMLFSKLNLSWSNQKKSSNLSRKRMDVNKLKDLQTAGHFREELEININVSDFCGDKAVEENWNIVKDIAWSTAKEVLGFQKRGMKDWFDSNYQEIGEILARRDVLRNQYLNNPANHLIHDQYKQLKSEIRRRLRRMQNDWWVDKAKLMQDLVEANDQKGFYDLLRYLSLTGKPPKGL